MVSLGAWFQPTAALHLFLLLPSHAALLLGKAAEIFGQALTPGEFGSRVRTMVGSCGNYIGLYGIMWDYVGIHRAI